MPRVLKQYAVTSPVGSNTPQTSVQISPNNDRRISLIIQNTGANPGLLQFSNPVKGDGSDLTIAALGILILNQDTTCPTEAINVGSALATTWAILESNSQ